MLTRNFMYMLATDMCIETANGTPSYCTNIEGGTISSYAPALGSHSTNCVFDSASFSKAKLVIGTGNTAEKSTDYCLESKITEGYDCSSLSRRYVQSEEKDAIYVYGVITNTGDSAITVSEVGLEMYDLVNTVSSYFLMARQVLDKPVTIEPGEAKTLNVRL